MGIKQENLGYKPDPIQKKTDYGATFVEAATERPLVEEEKVEVPEQAPEQAQEAEPAISNRENADAPAGREEEKVDTKAPSIEEKRGRGRPKTKE